MEVRKVIESVVVQKLSGVDGERPKQQKVRLEDLYVVDRNLR